VPQYNDELELSEGDVVVIQEIYEDGYCLGYCLDGNERRGNAGIFPLNCTRVVDEDAASDNTILKDNGPRYQSLGV
jgi:hypothetical protein